VARSRVKWKDCYVEKKGGEWYLTHRKHWYVC
jgi:hypothetical protein